MFERLKWLLPALTLFLALGLLSASSRQYGRGSAMTTAVLEVVGPVEAVLASSVRGVDTLWRQYFHLVGLNKENEALRATLIKQERQLVEMAELKAANERLATLLGLREAYPYATMKSAHVLAWDPGPWFRSIIISIGSNDGVRVDQAVLHGQGVVGRVIEATPNYSRVLLATDFNSSVDSFIQRTRAVGILSGQGSGPMSLKYVRKEEDVRPGDVVVTSGLDGYFPRGIAVGTVSRVNRQSADMFMTIDITPAVAFDRLEEVLVVVDRGEANDWLITGPRLRPLVDGPEEAQRGLAAEAVDGQTGRGAEE